MNRIYEFVEGSPITSLEERDDSLVLKINLKNAYFLITYPKNVQELFWDFYLKNELAFQDWSDYYEGSIEERQIQKEDDCLKLMDTIIKTRHFRVQSEGRFLKTKELLIQKDDVWIELTKEIWGEPDGGHNSGSSAASIVTP